MLCPTVSVLMLAPLGGVTGLSDPGSLQIWESHNFNFFFLILCQPSPSGKSSNADHPCSPREFLRTRFLPGAWDN